MLLRSVSFEPAGLIPSLKTNIGRLRRRTKKGLLFQTLSPIHARKGNARGSQMFGRLGRMPVGTPEFSDQRQHLPAPPATGATVRNYRG